MPSRTPPRRRLLSPITRSSAAALILVVGAAACRPAPPPVLGTVPAFTLTERSGKPLGSTDLAGHVWIADFIFTRCPDVCPALTARMALLQETLTTPPDPVRFVSITVDPAHDTPEVLTAYAARMGARESWFFVTGPRDTIATLLKQGFQVAFADDGPPATPITHSDRLVLVDRALQIRGYYHGMERDDLGRLERDATALRALKPS